MHGLVIQRGHRLEMDEELVEIEGDFDILVFQHFSELGCTGTDGEFDQDDDSVDHADVDECWGYADLLDTV